MERLEYIGKIALDYSKYPGEDFYCDGTAEDELLDIVKKTSRTEYGKAIEKSKNWPILYHLSPLRENIVEWLPMDKSTKVLEVGSGCGAITGVLSRKAGSVTCVELSKKRSIINAYRHSDCNNIKIHVGNFKDIEPTLPKDFDYICLVGVFEYSASYIGGENPFEDFIKLLMPHLRENGRLVIAIENKYGLKYFAGCKEDHIGTYFGGIENYPEGGNVKTFSRKGLERIFRRCGVKEYHFYYPYPDYKFMTTLYSDVYFPGKGELVNNLRNFDNDRMILFDEKYAFDGIVQDGLFSVFANSYMAIIGKDFDLKYVKYSNDRAIEYVIRTEICRDKKRKIYVRKYPLSKSAEAHVRSMEAAYRKLTEKYQGSKLEINKCSLGEENGQIYAEFEFVDGIPLSELMDKCLAKDDLEGFNQLFYEYMQRISYQDDFEVSDFDLIFSNIMVKGDTWTLIDYEWTFEKATSAKELAFRALYCYILESEKRNKLNFNALLEEIGVTEEETKNFCRIERDFQKFVTGNRMSMSQIREAMGYHLIVPEKWIQRYRDSANASCVQIYEDKGYGYEEENSYFVKDAYSGEHQIEFKIPISGDVAMLRIDPAMDACMVKILELTFNEQAIPLEKNKVVTVNGKVAKASYRSESSQPSIIFTTKDPNININLKNLDRRDENVLYARMEIARMPMDMAQDMANSVKRFL